LKGEMTVYFGQEHLDQIEYLKIHLLLENFL
jgi:hypothetical protein